MKFRDLRAQYHKLKPEIDYAIQSVLESSQFISGESVTLLEKQLAEYVGRKHCISCANGTDALQLSLMALKVGIGDAVFVPDFTYFATAEAASILGAAVIPVDINTKTFNILPEALESAIEMVIKNSTLKPKVVIPVDLFGLPADYIRIIPIAHKYGLKILEDSAQGFGGKIGHKKACSFGDISITSFFPAKPLGCYGDGGAIFVDNDDLNLHIRSLKEHGKSSVDKYDNIEIGMNSRLDTIQAAILLVKLKAFSEYELDAVNHAAHMYKERLEKSNVIIPEIPDGYYSSFAQYTVRFDNEHTRNTVRARLNENGIPSMIYYPRGIHQQKVYEEINWSDNSYPNTIEASKTVLSLPMHPYLEEKDIDRISKVIVGNE